MRKKIIYSRFIADIISWGEGGNNFSKGEMLNLLQDCVEHDITSFAHRMTPGNFATSNTFGAALSESGMDRAELQIISRMDHDFIASETNSENNFSKQKIMEAVDEALLQLKTDFLDLFLLKKDALAPEEMKDLIEQLKFQGKIKEFGFITSTTEVSSTKIPVEAFELDFSVLETKKESPSIFKNKREDFFIDNAFGDFFETKTEQIQRIEAVLDNLLPKYAANKPQLLLAWLFRLSNQIHAIISADNDQKISNASKAAKLEMQQMDFEAILEAATGENFQK